MWIDEKYSYESTSSSYTILCRRPSFPFQTKHRKWQSFCIIFVFVCASAQNGNFLWNCVNGRESEWMIGVRAKSVCHCICNFDLFEFDSSFAWIHFQSNGNNLQHILMSAFFPLFTLSSRWNWIGPCRQRWPSTHHFSMDIWLRKYPAVSWHRSFQPIVFLAQQLQFRHS